MGRRMVCLYVDEVLGETMYLVRVMGGWPSGMCLYANVHGRH